MKFLKYLYHFAIIILLTFNFNFAQAELIIPAELKIITDKETFLDPEYFTIQINGNSNIGEINIAEIKLQFDTQTLTFDSIDYSKEFCEFDMFEDINNQTGKINFVCMATSAKIMFNVANIKFKKINSGWNKITLNNSRFFLNNGLGESVLPITESHNFYIYK